MEFKSLKFVISSFIAICCLLHRLSPVIEIYCIVISSP